MSREISQDSVKVCTCVDCGRECTRDSVAIKAYGYKRLGGRINDRPYCTYCLNTLAVSDDKNSRVYHARIAHMKKNRFHE